MILVLVVLFWAWAFQFIKVALEELNPVQLTLMRFLIADAIILPHLYLTRKKMQMHRPDMVLVAALGIFGVTAYHVLLNYGEQTVSSGVASLIIAMAPVFVFIVSVLLLGESLTTRKLLGITAAMFGVVMIIIWGSGDFDLSVDHLSGAFAVLGAAFAATFFTTYGKSLFRRYPPSQLTSYAIVFATIPLLFMVAPDTEGLGSMGMRTWGSVIFLGIGSTFIAYQGWYYVLNTMEASRAVIYLQAIPVVAVFTGVAFLDETLTPLFLVGAILVLIGLYAINKPDPKAKDNDPSTRSGTKLPRGRK